ncbi:MAG: ABC transporter permease [bacterium]|nr:ABC transporter permease [bacterium]
MNGFISDLRSSLRMLTHEPGLVVAVMLTLGIGIGAATALFSIVDGVLLRRLSLPEPDRLVQMHTFFRGSLSANSEANLLDYSERIDAFEAVGGYAWIRRHLSGAGEASSILVVASTPSLFDVLRTSPLHGRLPSADDTEAGSPPQTMAISYAFWQSHFGGNRSALGAEILIEERPVEIVGIMPPSFAFPTPEAQAWMPFIIDPANPYSRENHFLRAVARLRDGVALEAAQQEVAAYGEQIVKEFPDNYSTFEFGAVAFPLRESQVRSARQPLLLLLGAVAVVLLIGCANVAGLLLVRADRRRRELAIRAAMGATGPRLVRLVVVESVLLSLIGGVLGLGLAWVGHTSLLRLAADALPRLDEVNLDLRILSFGIAISVLAGVLSAIVPAAIVSRSNIGRVLQEVGRSLSIGQKRQRSRRLLVAAEVALAVVLVGGSGLMLRSLNALLDVDLGMRTEDVLSMWISMPGQREENVDALRQLTLAIEQGAEALPGVRSAGIMRRLPIASQYGNWSIQIDGAEVDAIGEAPITQLQQTTPGALRTLGYETVSGRSLLDTDREGTVPVALVNESFARTFMEGQSAIGHRVRMFGPDSPWIEVIGVLRDTREYGPTEPTLPTLFVAAAQMGLNGVEPTSDMALVVHGSGDTLQLAAPLKNLIRSLEPAAVVRSVRTMEDVRASAADDRELPAVLLGFFSAVALILASIGIAGMVAMSVAMRQREIGIRLALGAHRSGVRRMIITQGLVPVVAGLLVGLAATLVVGHLLGEMLFGVQPWDLPSLTFTFVVVGLVSLAAVLTQSWRVGSLNLSQLLHTE